MTVSRGLFVSVSINRSFSGKTTKPVWSRRRTRRSLVVSVFTTSGQVLSPPYVISPLYCLVATPTACPVILHTPAVSFAEVFIVFLCFVQQNILCCQCNKIAASILRCRIIRCCFWFRTPSALSIWSWENTSNLLKTSHSHYSRVSLFLA